MEVVAHLSLPLVAHLRVVLAHQHTLTPVTGWPMLEDTLRRRPIDVVVLDPVGPGEIRVGEVRQLRRKYPSVPVVVYTVLSPAAMRAMMDLASSGVEHVVLHRMDDEPRRFLALLERLQGYALGDLLIAQLESPLGRLPEEVARAVERLIRVPDRYRRTLDIASDAGVNLRALYRHLDRAGLASPKMLLESARLLRAYGYLQDPGCLVEDVAARLGYSEPRILSRQFFAATGLRVSTVRQAMPLQDLIAVLARRVQVNGR